MEDQGKKIKTLLGVVVALAVLVTVLGGYLVYDKFIARTDNEAKESPKKEEKPKAEVKQINIEEIDRILQQTSIVAWDKKDISDFNTLPNAVKVDIALYNLSDGDYEALDGSGLKATVLEDKLKAIFGENISIKHENIMCLCGEVYYHYDATNNTYKYNKEKSGHGGADYFKVYNKIFNIEIQENQVIVSLTKLLWFSGWGETDGYWAEYNTKAARLFNHEEDMNEAIHLYLENYKSYKAKSPVYTYTFEEENGKYVLVALSVK